MRKRVVFIAAAVVLTALVALFLFARSREPAPEYRLDKVERGDISSAVSAAGTLSAVTTVQVGSQVSGQIAELLADFNTPVQANQVIARIDPAYFQARVQQAEAELQVAQANVAIHVAAQSRSRADLDNAQQALAAAAAGATKARVALENALRNLARLKDLRRSNIATQHEVDEAVDALASRDADLNAAQAQERARRSAVASQAAEIKMAASQVVNARAQVLQRQAALTSARIDMEHTVIRAPVSGVVIERSVDLGQTVAASLQAPTLFTIAQDLRQMQVETSIDEADIGRIRVGQQATFTVDSFPGKTFAGEVTQIRQAPKVIQNVVTYSVIIATANPDLRLLPGMTTDTSIAVDQRPNALKVPNAALRFRPLSPPHTFTTAFAPPRR